MKILHVIGKILLGVLGLVVLLYLIGVAVNWRDQPPTAAALEMKRILSGRAPIADADNGYVYTLGFSVPAPDDPQRAGVLRRDWLEAVSRDPNLINAEPFRDGIGFAAATLPSMQNVRKHCGGDYSVECRDAFRAARLHPRMGVEELLLARYRALLQHSGWREVVPLDSREPLPGFGDIIEGQRLLFVDLASRANSAPPEEIAAELRDDLAFWRETQKSADILITKMIAVAAIRQHFIFGTLVMREMPAARPEVIAAWSVPFSAEEMSMRRVMAGELAFAEGVMLQWFSGDEGNFIEPYHEGFTVPGRIASSLTRPYYQHQDQMNFYSAQYLDFAKRFEVPFAQYAQVAESLKATETEGRSFHLYNAAGHAFRGIAGPWPYTDYPIRIASIEGMRRAALLTAQLRERSVPLDRVTTELSGAELRNPFDDKPFEWSEEEEAVVYVGPFAESGHKRHLYFY